MIVRYRGEIQDKDKVLDRVKSEMKSLTENIRAAEVECKNAKSHVQRTKHLLHQAEDEYKKEQEDIEKEDSGADEARCVFEKERERERVRVGFFLLLSRLKCIRLVLPLLLLSRCRELKSHVEILLRSLDEKDAKVKEQETVLDQVKDKEKQMKDEYEAYKANLDEVENKSSEASNEAGKFSNRLSQVGVRKESLTEKKLQLERQRQEYDKILAQENKELEQVQAQATAYCSEEELERAGGRSAKDPQELNELIARFNQRIADEQGEKDFDQLHRSAQRRQKAVDKLERQVSRLVCTSIGQLRPDRARFSCCRCPVVSRQRGQTAF